MFDPIINLVSKSGSLDGLYGSEDILRLLMSEFEEE
jgi:hypothetical protein